MCELDGTGVMQIEESISVVLAHLQVFLEERNPYNFLTHKTFWNISNRETGFFFCPESEDWDGLRGVDNSF